MQRAGFPAASFPMRPRNAQGIYFIMGIKFRHNQSGLLYLPYFPLERMLPPRAR